MNELKGVFWLVCLTLFLVSCTEQRGELKVAIVSRVIDGDTFVLDTGERVRLICIDTPEKGQVGFNEARLKLAEFVMSGGSVTLEKDVSDVDMFGRLLRYVYVDRNGTSINVNGELVRLGLAKVSRYPPDEKYCGDFEKLVP